MKLKIDENLPKEMCAAFRQSGFDATTVDEEDMTGADDQAIHAVCQRERRVFVTLDLGFANIQSYPPAGSAGVVVLRLKEQSRATALAVIRPLIALLAEERIEGRLWIVDHHRIRIRS